MYKNTEMLGSMEKNIKIIYKVKRGNSFEVDGNINWDRMWSMEGSRDYVLYQIREMLRKMENGQIKVVKNTPNKERDWEDERER